MFKKINKKGFTLAELLIVVAIIGVLVAISIPIFTAQLEKARIATNQANIRSAKAAAAAAELTDESAGLSFPAYYVYDISTGAITSAGRQTTVPSVPTATGSIYQTINVQITANNEISSVPYDDGNSTHTTVATRILVDAYH